MAGGDVSYNLRPNKFVERRLFVDLIGLTFDKPGNDFVYISMGGPQLEDHKLIHYQHGLEKLISIEADPLIYDRQRFNVRPGCIELKLQSVDEMIANFTEIDEKYPNEDYIIWLDYASANERYDQLSEFESLVSTLNSGDFVKITINSNVTTLGERLSDESMEDLQTRRYQTAKGQMREYFDSEMFNHKDMTRKGFSKVIRRGVEIAILSGIRSDLSYDNLLTFAYRDGPHTMMNVGYKIHENVNYLEKLRSKVEKDWGYIPRNIRNEQNYDILKINIPNLSIKERLLIDSKILKDNANEIHDMLPFKFAKNDSQSIAILEQYLNHYRRYPNFIDVVI
jgi:hypothetical protein